MIQKLKFELEEFEPVGASIDEDYEKVKQDRFSKVKIKLFGDGENAHTEPVDIEALKRSADSAYDIPLIAELNPYRSNEDFGGHGTLTGKEFSFGFVKESKDNPIVFEKNEAGKTFITLYGLIWKKYFNNVVEIIKNSQNKVEVSVELDIVKGKTSKRGKPIMEQFVLNAITFLGKITTAACPGANAELCFSNEYDSDFIKDKNEYLMKHFSQDVAIDNSLEKACKGKWTNPRLKLLNPILKASNRNSLLNEAYLYFGTDDAQELTLSDVCYPHHVMKNGELVLHKKGVQAAFSKLSKEGKLDDKAKEHLQRHFQELGLSADNYVEFGLTEDEFKIYFAEDCRKEEINLALETEVLEEEKEEKTEEVLEEEKCVNEGQCETQEEEQGIAEENAKDSEEEVETAQDGEQMSDDASQKAEEKKETDAEEEMSSDDGVAPEEPLETADEVSVEALKERLHKLEAENQAYMDKIAAMQDYEELKQFKVDTIAKEEQEQEMRKMAAVFESMECKGVNISEETKQELLSNRENFANIDAWSNYVKAYAFDNCEKTEEGIIKFDMPTVVKETVPNSSDVWSSLRNKYNN